MASSLALRAAQLVPSAFLNNALASNASEAKIQMRRTVKSAPASPWYGPDRLKVRRSEQSRERGSCGTDSKGTEQIRNGGIAFQVQPAKLAKSKAHSHHCNSRGSKSCRDVTTFSYTR